MRESKEGAEEKIIQVVETKEERRGEERRKSWKSG
jgi:hypothetical protein